jgi:flagellar hook protein FlgE
VVGDNIANANTIGFKGSRANFEDILARSLGGGAAEDIGLGSRLANVQRMMTQGALLGTGSTTDLAIKGNGFFIVRGSAEGMTGSFYTRAGQFHLDKDGKLVNVNGLVAQGYVVDAAGNLVKKLTDVQIPTSQMPPVTTTSAQIFANLDAGSTAPTNPWPASPIPGTTNLSSVSNYQTTVTVYDSLGKAHTVNVYFRKEAGAGAWSWHALVDGGEVTGGTAGTWVEGATGTLSFDSQGRLMTEATSANDFDFLGAVQNQAIAFDFGDSVTTDGGTGLKGSTSFASKSVATYVNQNGYSSGSLSGITIEPNGTVSGVFSNGQRRTVGQVLLANFQSPESMQRIGGNLYVATTASGPALVGEAANGGLGAINAGSLEQSNVDLARQFVDMITFQRGFQANSRTITTADQMLQEVIGIKR